MTNYHVINKKFIKENNIIKLTINDDFEDKSIILDDERKIYLNEKYDLAIIEITNKDKMNNINYLELDENINKYNSNYFY